MTVELHWIPLGAGTPVVRASGRAFEAVAAALGHRARCDLYHSVLAIGRPDGRYWVEVAPVPDGFGPTRGVVGVGAVGLRVLGRLRPFRYEVRRWLDGVVPDLAQAVASPVVVTDDAATVERVFAAVAAVPCPTWGLDELHAGEMWTSNSVVSWVLAVAGLDLDGIPMPRGARAPGWDAGRVVATRTTR